MLTPRQRLFVLQYLVDLNATQAAVRSGYSTRTANQQGPRLLKNKEVAAEIRAAMDERAKRLNVKSGDVLKELADIGLHRMTVGLGRRFAPAIRMHSKQKALDQLSRHLGPYGEKSQALCLQYFVAGLTAASVTKAPPNNAVVEHEPPPPPTPERQSDDWPHAGTHDDWSYRPILPAQQAFADTDYDLD